MKVRYSLPVGLVALTLTLAVPTWAQEGHEHPEGGEPAAGEMPGMTPEMQEMMAAYQEAGTPGAPHAWLAKSAGSWKTTTTMWMAPGAEPMTSEGKADRKMILNGRVMIERFEGDMGGQSFEGLGLQGYNNVTEKYWSIWLDSMSTGMGSGEGTCAEDHSTCTYEVTWIDPMTGEPMNSRIELEHMGEDSAKMTMYETRDGTEFKSMEILYERTMGSQAAREMKETASEMKEKASEMKEKMQADETEEAPEAEAAPE